MKFKRILRILLPAIAALLALVSQAVLAHAGRDVASFRLEVGFFVEPAIEGQMNGIDLHVTNAGNSSPVTGLENTLKVEITCIPGNVSQTFSIEPVDPDSDPGHYNNGFIPTEPGQYSFRFFGTIEGTPVNETFTSGPDTFSDVLSATDVEFPIKTASLRELHGVTRAAQKTAGSANTLAWAGIGLGGVGTVLGILALVKRKK